MQIVIDIPDEIYERAKVNIMETMDFRTVRAAIFNGTVLPKGHDKLVEMRAMIKALFDKKTIDDVPTIVEADETESEG